MPEGTVAPLGGDVNKICSNNALPIAYEIPSRNDLLEGLDVIIKFILKEKRRKSKRMEDKTQVITKVYDKIHAVYAEKFKEPSDNIDEFLKLVRGGGSILDAGCGPGVDVAYMFGKGFAVTGVDLSEGMLEIARKKSPNSTFQKADIRKLDFEPNTFDGILASYSLIHIPKQDVLKTVQDFYKFLKPEGVLYVGIQEGEPKEIFVIEPLKPDEKIFLDIMSAEEVKDILSKAGLDIVSEFTRPAENKEEFDFNKLTLIVKKNEQSD